MDIYYFILAVLLIVASGLIGTRVGEFCAKRKLLNVNEEQQKVINYLYDVYKMFGIDDVRRFLVENHTKKR